MAATVRNVDLTNVKEGGNFRPRRKPEGDYRAKIAKVEDHQPKNKDKGPGWVYTIMVEGDGRSTYPFYVNPDPKEVWKIGVICRAAGINVKNAKVRFDPNKLVGKAIGIALVDDEYEGRVKSSIDDVFPISEVGANADEDIDEIEDDEEVIEDDEEVEVPEDDEEEEEPEPTPPPKRRTRRKPAPEPEPEDDDDEDDEEEPPPPPRKRTARAKKAAPPPPADDDEDDLDDLDLDDLD